MMMKKEEEEEKKLRKEKKKEGKREGEEEEVDGKVVVMEEGVAVTIIDCPPRARHHLCAPQTYSLIQSFPESSLVKVNVFGLQPGSTTPHRLCDMGRVTQPLCGSVSSSTEQG